MTDELPDLNAFLSKRGGNAQGRGEENPAGKTDISSKLSALVKKGGSTGTHPSVQSALGSLPGEGVNAQMPPLEGTAAAPPPAPPAPVAPPDSPIGLAPQAPPAPPTPAAPTPTFDSPIGLSAPAPQAPTESPIGLAAPAAPAPTESPIGLSRPPQPAVADNAPAVATPDGGSNGQNPGASISNAEMDSAARWGQLAGYNQNFSDAGQTSPHDATSQPGGSPSAVPRLDEGYTPSVSREMPKPGQPLDKLKAPQAKPMSTLSSSNAPPLLKTPPKTPGRPAQPYSFKPQGIEPGREGMAPKAPTPSPINKPPQPVQAPKPAMPQAPTPSNQGGGSSAVSSGGPSGGPQGRPPGAPPGPQQGGPGMQPQQAPQQQPVPQQRPPQPQPAARVETDAEKLARAFAEEARALQESQPAPIAEHPRDPSLKSASEYEYTSSNFQKLPADYPAELAGIVEDSAPSASAAPPEPARQQAPKPEPPAAREAGPKSSLSSLFDSGVISSRPEPEPEQPKKVGFGSLLGGGAGPEGEPHRNTLGDLMIPTGEHNTLFAPDRREPSETSAFDEISAQVEEAELAAEQSFAAAAAAASNSFDAPPAEPSMRADNSQPPAFGSLFSNEIVTSGTDFGGGAMQQAESFDSGAGTMGDAGFGADSDMLEPPMPVEDTKVTSKSIAISKLIEAVNQGDAKDAPADSSFGTAGDVPNSLMSNEIVGGGASPFAPPQAKEEQAQIMPDVGALSPSALEALAAFVPQAGEEQHETKGLLAKLKAKDAAVKAAQKAEEAKKAEDAKEAEAGTASGEAFKAPAKEDDAPPAKSSLSSLLGGAAAQEEAPSTSRFDQPISRPAPKNPADDDEGSSLGDAISDALDKLLDGDDAPPVSTPAAPAPVEEAPADTGMGSSLSKLLNDDPGRFDRPIGGGADIKEAAASLEDAIAASAADPSAAILASGDNHPLAMTSSKVDALSRLLEVASKAPDKPPEDKAAGESGSGMRSMINQQPGARPGDSMDNPEMPPREAFTSPFGGGTSPFSAPSQFGGGNQPAPPPAPSPFGSAVNSSNSGVSGVSMTHTPAGAFSPTGQSQPASSGFTGTGSMADMPKASGIASDAISARIAALNRKLEEQTKGPGGSGSGSSTTAPMVSPGQAAPPAPPPSPMDYPPPSMTTAPTQEFVPNPIVDDSPATRAELVNRILGSAKIAQEPTNPSRSMQDLVAEQQQVSQMHLPKAGKGQPPKSKSRARGGRPGINPLVVLLGVAVIVIGCLGGYVVLKDPTLLKGIGDNVSKVTKVTDTKVTVDQAIKSGDLDKAVELLEAKKESGKISAAEAEKLYGLYYQLADKNFNNDGDPAEAIAQLEKIPKKTKKYKDAQKLLRKLKKKAEK